MTIDKNTPSYGLPAFVTPFVIGISIVVLYCSCCSRPSTRLQPGVLRMGGIGDLAESNNLAQIWGVLHEALGQGYRFPETLNDVVRMSPQSSNLFVSPATKHKPGNIDSIQNWTDYVYVENNTDESQFEALVISPPQNYAGRYGYVLLVNGFVYKVSPEKAKEILDKPWLFDDVSNESVISDYKKRIKVVMPAKYLDNSPI